MKTLTKHLIMASMLMVLPMSIMAQSEVANTVDKVGTPYITNPMLWSDVPDPDVIRVGDTFYMVTTTMHLMPGAPVMKSKDLANWETVGYILSKDQFAEA